MRNLRWDFTQGITLLGRPNKGQARFLMDGMMENGRIRPISKPDVGTLTCVTGLAGAGQQVASVWMRRNLMHYGAQLRKWAPIMRAGVEVDCFSPEAVPPGNSLGNAFPQKFIAGRYYPLGIPQPNTPPRPLPYNDMLTIGGTFYETGGVLDSDADFYYCVLIKLQNGYVQSDTIHLTSVATPYNPTDNTGNLLSILYNTPTSLSEGSPAPTASSTKIGSYSTKFNWTPPSSLPGFMGIAIFRGEGSSAEGSLMLIADLDASVNSYFDNGQTSVYGTNLSTSLTDYKTANDIQALPTTAQYVHTYQFSQNGYTVEGAPSTPSTALPVGVQGGLQFDLVGDGFWSMPGLQTITLTNAVVKGPATLGESYTAKSVAMGGVWTNNQTGMGIVGSVTGGDIPAGFGAQAFLAGVNAPAVRVNYVMTPNGDGTQSITQQLLLPEFWGVTSLTTMDTLKTFHGGSVYSFFTEKGIGISGSALNALALQAQPAATSTTGLGFPCCSGEEIILYQPDSGHSAVQNAEIFPVIRNNATSNLLYVRGNPNAKWPSTYNSIRWARNLGYISLGGFSSTQQSLAPGTLVLISGIPNVTPKVFTAYPSPQGLYLAGDWTGLEYLNWTPAPATITLSFYPNNNGINARNIYRVDTGAWLLVDSIPIDQRTFQDTISASNLGEALQGAITTSGGETVLALPPPQSLRGLTVHLNALHGIAGDQVVYSPPGWPDAFPTAFSYQPDSNPVALASFDSALIVLCRNRIFRLDGSNPDSYIPSPTLAEDGCLAAGSVQVTPFGLVFLGTRGICLFDGQHSECLTLGRLEPWQLFPRWEANRNLTFGNANTITDTNRAGTVMTHLQDSRKGLAASWIAAMENATLLNAASQDNLWTGVKASDVQDWYHIGSAFHRGRYYLYGRSWQMPEGVGCWVMDFNSPGYRLLNLGLQPIDTCVDGDDFYLLLNGDQ